MIVEIKSAVGLKICSCQQIADNYNYETRELDRKKVQEQPWDSNVQRLERGKASKGGHKRMTKERGRKPGK